MIGTDITFTESDERLAVHKFRQLIAQEKRETIDIPIAAGKASDGSLARAIRQTSKPEPIPTDAADAFFGEVTSNIAAHQPSGHLLSFLFNRKEDL